MIEVLDAIDDYGLDVVNMATNLQKCVKIYQPK
jgi:hypothetical protein